MNYKIFQEKISEQTVIQSPFVLHQNVNPRIFYVKMASLNVIKSWLSSILKLKITKSNGWLSYSMYFLFLRVSWSCYWRDKKGIKQLTAKCFEYYTGKDRNCSCSKRGFVAVLCVSKDHPVSCEWLRKRMAYSFSDSSFRTHESSPHQGDKITSLINQPHVPFCILDCS